jgi:prevent-host-death family protein
MTALDLRKKLGSVLNDVSLRKEQVIISRANKPLVVMISVEEYEEKVLKKNREQKLRDISARMEQWREKHKKKTAHIDVVKAIREIRESR